MGKIEIKNKTDKEIVLNSDRYGDKGSPIDNYLGDDFCKILKPGEACEIDEKLFMGKLRADLNICENDRTWKELDSEDGKDLFKRLKDKNKVIIDVKLIEKLNKDGCIVEDKGLKFIFSNGENKTFLLGGHIVMENLK